MLRNNQQTDYWTAVGALPSKSSESSLVGHIDIIWNISLLNLPLHYHHFAKQKKVNSSSKRLYTVEIPQQLFTAFEEVKISSTFPNVIMNSRAAKIQENKRFTVQCWNLVSCTR